MKTWIKRTLIGLFGVSILVGGIAACGHRHHGWSGERRLGHDPGPGDVEEFAG